MTERPNTHQPVPKCGASDERNIEYQNNFSFPGYYENLFETSKPIIIDGGAHRGESIKFFKSIFPNCTIYSFEPDPENFKHLQQVAEEFETIAFNLALSKDTRKATYFKQGISHLGGLQPIKKDSKDSLGYAQRAENEALTVNTTTLTHFVHEYGLKKVNLLKVDVQGFEVEVLEGGEGIFDKIDCVTVEISLYDFYEGSRDRFLSVQELMVRNQFELYDFAKVSKNPKNFRTDWVEAVYKKKNITI